MTDIARSIFVESGRRGGAAGRGASKRRTLEQCKAAAFARWEKVRRKKNLKPKQNNPK